MHANLIIQNSNNSENRLIADDRLEIEVFGSKNLQTRKNTQNIK